MLIQKKPYLSHECKKVPQFLHSIWSPQCTQYIGETKRHLHQRFGEHRRSILNYGHLLNPTLVSEHFNQADHSINNVLHIPLQLIPSNRDSVRTAREAHLIDKAMTVEPHGINRRDEQ